MPRPEVTIARTLRRSMTLPEVMLWQELRAGKTGLKFRRQHPIGPYIADFCCIAARLVVEIDGEAHNRADAAEHDLMRDRFMKENGFRVLRVTAIDVQRDVAAVIAAVVALAAPPLHHQRAAGGPPPRSGEE